MMALGSLEFVPCFYIILDTIATKVCEFPHRQELKMTVVLVWAKGILYSIVCLPTALLHGLHCQCVPRTSKYAADIICPSPVIPALVKHIIIVLNLSMEKLRH